MDSKQLSKLNGHMYSYTIKPKNENNISHTKKLLHQLGSSIAHTIFFTVALFLNLIITPAAHAKELPVQEFTLENGMKVIFLKEDDSSAAIRLVIHAGYNDFPNDKSEVPHLLEHVLFDGTEKHSAQEVYIALDAASYSKNASVRRYQTVFELNGGLFESVESLRILFEIMAKPLISLKAIEVERKAIYREYGVSSGLLGKLSEMLSLDRGARARAARAFSSTPDKFKSALSLEQITRDDLLNAYKKYYTPANMTLIIVGNYKLDFLNEIITRLSKKYFGEDGIKGKHHEIHSIQHVDFNAPILFDVGFSPLFGSESDVEMGYITDGLKNYQDNKPDFILLTQLARHIAFEELRLKSGITYTPIVTGGAVTSEYGVMMTSANVELGHEDEALARLKKVYSRITSGDFSEGLFNIAKSETQTYVSQNITGAVSLADYLVDHYDQYLNTGSYQKPITSLQKINREDITKLAKAYFIPSKQIIIVSKPLMTYAQLVIGIMGLVFFLACLSIIRIFKKR